MTVIGWFGLLAISSSAQGVARPPYFHLSQLPHLSDVQQAVGRGKLKSACRKRLNSYCSHRVAFLICSELKQKQPKDKISHCGDSNARSPALLLLLLFHQRSLKVNVLLPFPLPPTWEFVAPLGNNCATPTPTPTAIPTPPRFPPIPPETEPGD